MVDDLLEQPVAAFVGGLKWFTKKKCENVEIFVDYSLRSTYCVMIQLKVVFCSVGIVMTIAIVFLACSRTIREVAWLGVGP